MTKKHFIALADALREFNARMECAHPTAIINTSGPAAVRLLTESLADFCQSQNPHFDRARWLAYIAGECGPNGGPITDGIHKGRTRTL